MRIVIAIVIGLLLGAAVGWQLAPRMRVPRMERQQLLRQRAADFYAASRRLDKWSMVRMYTPARQFDETEALRKDADLALKALARQSQDARADQEKTARAISPDSLEVVIDGDWAITQGEYTLYVTGHEVKSRLDPYLWVFDDGQWWVYDWKIVERNTYGHPPDFAMHMDPTVSPGRAATMQVRPNE